ELEQVAVGRLLGVEDDLDRLGVRAVVAVGRVRDVAAGVADAGRDHARLLAEQVLHPPEAPAGQDRLLHCSVHGPSSLGSRLSLYPALFLARLGATRGGSSGCFG